MRGWIAGIVLLANLAGLNGAASKETVETKNTKKYIVVVGASSDYSRAVKRAKELSSLTRIPYKTQGRIYDAKRGLIYPQSWENADLAGGYSPRDDGDTYLSVEYAADYEENPQAEFLIIGGMDETKKNALGLLSQYRAKAPEARLLECVVPEEVSDNSTVEMYIVVLSQSDDYAGLVKRAKGISSDTGIKYDGEGMVYDPKRGLIIPDDSDDDMWAGSYYPRRYDSRFISIEYSKYYLDKPKGKYAIIGFMDMKAREAKRMHQWFQKYVPDAVYSHKPFWQGCIH